MQESTFIQAKQDHTPIPSSIGSVDRTRLLQIRLALLHLCVLGLSMVFVDPPTMAPLGSLIALTMLCSILISARISTRQSPIDLINCNSEPIVDDGALHTSSNSCSDPDIEHDQLILGQLEHSIAAATRSGRQTIVYTLDCRSMKTEWLGVLMPELSMSLSQELSPRSSIFQSAGTRIRILSDSASSDRYSYRLAHRLMNHCEQWLIGNGVADATVRVGISQFPGHGRKANQLINQADSAAQQSSDHQVSGCSMARMLPCVDLTNVISLPSRASISSNDRRLRVHA